MDEEAAALRKRFAGVNRAKFARDFGVKGGQANIYNHIQGLRPINLDAARAYARGFNCTIQEISPRLAKQLAETAPYTSDTQREFMRAGEPEAEYATERRWPFPKIDEAKVYAMQGDDAVALERAFIVAASNVGLDIKKKV